VSKDKWLKQNLESEEQKAVRRRLAKENTLSLADVGKLLDDELAKKQAAPTPASQPKKPTAPQSTPAARTVPRLIEERPDPEVIAERPTPRAVGDPAPPSAKPASTSQQPSPDLVELVRLYQSLSERDRLELLMMARIKAKLSRQ